MVDNFNGRLALTNQTQENKVSAVKKSPQHQQLSFLNTTLLSVMNHKGLQSTMSYSILRVYNIQFPRNKRFL